MPWLGQEDPLAWRQHCVQTREANIPDTLETIFRLGIVNGVTADNHCVCFGYLVMAAAENICKYIRP